MSKRRIIFFAIFGGYHLIILFFTLYIGSGDIDFGLLAELYGKISWFKYGALIGLVLFLTDFMWAWLEDRKIKKEHDAFRLENNTLKAKVYDYQQAGKEPVKKETPPAK